MLIHYIYYFASVFLATSTTLSQQHFSCVTKTLCRFQHQPKRRVWSLEMAGHGSFQLNPGQLGYIGEHTTQLSNYVGILISLMTPMNQSGFIGLSLGTSSLLSCCLFFGKKENMIPPCSSNGYFFFLIKYVLFFHWSRFLRFFFH